MMTIAEWNKHISSLIQGSFWEQDMAVLKEEVEKLLPGEIYLEIGVDEGKSLSTAHYYAKDGVFTVGVDYIDSPNRAPYMNIPSGDQGPNPQGQGLIHIGSKVIYIQGDSQQVAQIWNQPISLLFIDGDHSYEGVSKDTKSWEGHVKTGGTILYHDFDHPDVKRWLDEKYGNDKEVLHDKIVRVRV